MEAKKMIVQLKRTDRATEVFQTVNFCLSDAQDFHESLVSVKILTDEGKKLCKKTHFGRWVKSLFVKGKFIPLETPAEEKEEPAENDHTEVVCEAPKE
jgi:hypothetical protein